VITGPTGVGKSWIDCELGHQACRQEYSVLYTRLNLLILDDWGLDRLNTEQRRMVLALIE
jgi:DNA replication protein DnaC